MLSSCAGQLGAAGPTAISEAAATGSAESADDAAADELAGALLPESAVGPDATVHQLPSAWVGPWSGWWSGSAEGARSGWWSGSGHGWWSSDGSRADHHGWLGHRRWGGHHWWAGGDGTDTDETAAEPSVEPAACADALAALPTHEDDEMPVVAAQVAATDQPPGRRSR